MGPPTRCAAIVGALLLLAMLSMSSGLDRAVAGMLFDWEGHRWALRDGFFMEHVLHRMGRELSAAAWIGACCMWIASLLRDDLIHWRRPLAHLALSILLSTLLVAWIKSWTNMDCPWDLREFGGLRPYVSLLSVRPPSLPHNACFPAGHASAGYAWMALYFFFLSTRAQWRWIGLAIGIGAGLLFGIAQQLRGAHFLSHDLVTIAICWMTPCLIARLQSRARDPAIA